MCADAEVELLAANLQNRLKNVAAALLCSPVAALTLAMTALMLLPKVAAVTSTWPPAYDTPHSAMRLPSTCPPRPVACTAQQQ